MSAPAGSGPGEPAGRPFDWKGNPLAKANREDKAEAIFRWCWENNVDPFVMVGARDRNRIAREAGGYREMPGGKRRPVYSSVSEETWQLVVAKHRREYDRTSSRALQRS